MLDWKDVRLDCLFSSCSIEGNVDKPTNELPPQGTGMKELLELGCTFA